jgi:hypothetical protein
MAPLVVFPDIFRRTRIDLQLGAPLTKYVRQVIVLFPPSARGLLALEAKHRRSHNVVIVASARAINKEGHRSEPSKIFLDFSRNDGSKNILVNFLWQSTG